jgi:hypothetical protein
LYSDRRPEDAFINRRRREDRKALETEFAGPDGVALQQAVQTFQAIEQQTQQLLL